MNSLFRAFYALAVESHPALVSLHFPARSSQVPGTYIDNHSLFTDVPKLAQHTEHDSLEGKDHADVDDPVEVGNSRASLIGGDTIIGDEQSGFCV